MYQTELFTIYFILCLKFQCAITISISMCMLCKSKKTQDVCTIHTMLDLHHTVRLLQATVR